VPRAATAAQPKTAAVSAFSECARQLAAAAPEQRLAALPRLLAEKLDAARAELWTLAADAAEPQIEAVAGVEVAAAAAPMRFVSGIAAAQKPVEGVALKGHDEFQPAVAAGLTHVTAMPLAAAGKNVGALLAYSTAAPGAETLRWWRLYADIAAALVADTLLGRTQQRSITQLSLLFEATRLLNSTLDVSELLDLILTIARDEVKADRGTVFMLDPKRRELWSIVASGLEHQEIRLPLGSGVAGRVAETGETINVADAYTLPFFDRSFDQRFRYRTESLLSLPIRHRTGEIVGVIQLLNRRTGGQFTPQDEDFMSKLSAHIAMALENARLHHEMLEKQRMERDLALARSIQRGLLPDAPPVVPGFDIAVVNEMCYAVGGDYYDLLNLGPQTLLVVIADVEGKGVSSALVMSNLQATLRALVMHLHSLEVLALSVNDMICQDTRSGKYLSIFMGLIDTRGNKLHYINCGHVPPVLLNGTTGSFKLLDKGGTIIGLFPNAEYVRGTEKLSAGDILVCCTDGILEARNTTDEEFGTERLIAAVSHLQQRSAHEIVDRVMREVADFGQSDDPDDKVLLVVKVTSDGGASTSAKMPAVVWQPPAE
jgi:sigma-B regulation protein RsbU (phosphoserine phosphatase)